MSTPPSKLNVWIMASRPKTLPAAVGPVLVGIAVAINRQVFNLWPALAALFGAILLQIAANYSNDYFDFKKGADTEERMGPTRVTAQGLLTEREILGGLIVTIVLSIFNGLYLIYVGGLLILWIGVSSILAMLLYSGGPLPYGYKGLGDIMVMIFFGLFAVVGTFYVQALSFVPLIWLVWIPSGFLVTAVLVVNNYRDIETDAATGKRTLAVILGKKGTFTEYYFLITGSYLLLFVLMALGYNWTVLLPLLTLPLAYQAIRDFSTLTGRPLNKVLAATARLSMVFGFLFAIGLIWA